MFKKVGVLGAGVMGSGIAQKIAHEGIAVSLLDRTEDDLDRGMERINEILKEGIEKRIYTEERAGKVLSLINPTLSHEELSECDLLIEAVYEDREIKKGLFQKMDLICKKSTIFATNTSSFSVTELAKSVRRKGSFLGMHFFYHPVKNRFLEIIPSEYTSGETLERVLLFSKILGKISVKVKDRPGFVVNRFFVPWLNEAVRIMDDGVANIPTIEKVCMEVFRIPLGPFGLMNATGIPIAYHSALSLAQKLGEFYEPAPSLRVQTESRESWRLKGEVDLSKSGEIRERMLGVIFYVVSQMLDEETAEVEDIEKGAKIALRWRYGPFELMNREGLSKSGEYVKKIVQIYGLREPEALKRQVSLSIGWRIRSVNSFVKEDSAYIVLSRPERMNALDRELLRELEENLQRYEEDQRIERIVLEGEGRAFVAGANLRFFINCIERKDFDKIVEFTRMGHQIFNMIEGSKKPIICKLTGLALGGGAELALASSTIVAAPNAYLAFPETGLGIYPGLGGCQRLSRRVGRELAKYFIFTGFPVDSQLGKRLGIFEEVLPLEEMDTWIRREKEVKEKYPQEIETPEELGILREQFSDENIHDLLEGRILDEHNPLLNKVRKVLAFKAPLALKLANQLIDEGFSLPLGEALELELGHLEEIFRTEDALEGLRSVGRKRPKFKGK